MNSGDILKEATRLMATDRQDKYGDFVENHQHISALWSAYLRTEITPDQCALMMALVKIARTRTSHTEPDHYIDAAAYIAGAGRCATEGKKA
jgi:hypothetical protein